MKIHFTTLLKSIIYGAITPVIISCTNGQNDNNLLSYIDTRVGTAASTTHTAGMFGKHTEEYGQTLPAVLELLDTTDTGYRAKMHRTLLLP